MATGHVIAADIDPGGEFGYGRGAPILIEVIRATIRMIRILQVTPRPDEWPVADYG